MLSADSRTGESSALPPVEGWPIQSWNESPVVEFTAGGAIPLQLANAIAVMARFEYYANPADARLVGWYMSKARMR